MHEEFRDRLGEVDARLKEAREAAREAQARLFGLALGGFSYVFHRFSIRFPSSFHTFPMVFARFRLPLRGRSFDLQAAKALATQALQGVETRSESFSQFALEQQQALAARRRCRWPSAEVQSFREVAKVALTARLERGLESATQQEKEQV